MSEMILFHRLSMVGVITTAYTMYAQPAQVPSLMLIVVMCIIAFLIRDLIFREVDLFQDWKLEREKIERKKNFIFGDEVESLNPEKQEREFRLNFAGKPIKVVAIASFWALPVSFYIANQFRAHPADVQMSLIPALLIVSTIAQTSHFSQFVLPVLWSVLGVFVAAMTKTEISVVKSFVFILAVVANFVIYNQIRMSCLVPEAHDKAWLPRAAKSSIWITVGFSVLFLIFSSLLPDSIKLPEPEKPEIISQKTKGKLVKVVAEKVVQAEELISRREGEAPPQRSQKEIGPPVEQVAQNMDAPKGAENPGDNAPPEEAMLNLPSGRGEQRKIAEGEKQSQPSGDLTGSRDGFIKGDFKPPSGASNGGDDFEPKMTGGYGPEDMEQNLKDRQALAPKDNAFEHLEALDKMAKDLPKDPSPGVSSREPIQPAELEKALKEIQPQQHVNQELVKEELKKFANLSPEEKQKYVDKLPNLKQVIERDRAARKNQPIHPAKLGESDLGRNGLGKNSGDGSGGGKNDGKQDGRGDPSGPEASGEVTPQQAEKVGAVKPDRSDVVEAQPESHTEPKPEEKPVEKEKPREEKVQQLEEKLNFIVEALIKNMKMLLFVAVLTALLVYFLRASRRQKENGKWQLSEAEKKTLAEEIRKIRKASLTPDQEIVETYNVMLNAFDIVQLGREAGTPARIHVDMVSKRLPSLNEPLSFATDSFDRVLYGMTHPSGDELTRFRQSTKKVFKQFDISVA